MRTRWQTGRTWFHIFLIMILFFIPLSNAWAETDATSDASALQLEAEAAILIDADTGQVLYEMNADEPRAPASMTKMMTEYLVMDAIKAGEIQWDSVVTISERASSIGGSGQLIAAGQRYTVKDLFRMMSIYSSNDATVALAEFISTSEEKFVAEMNRKARDIGLSNDAFFTNATGLNRGSYGDLHPDVEGKTLLTARDAAQLAQSLLDAHPDVLEYTSTPQARRIEGDETTELMNNFNWMLESWKPIDNLFAKQFAYDGLDGLKTGFTNEAGYCFTGTALRDGMRLISVVMFTESEAKRFQETAKLMDYGFNNFEKKMVLTAKSELEDFKMVPIKKGKEKEVNAVIDQGVAMVVRKGSQPEDIKVEATVFEADDLIAPIEQGQQLGTVTVTYTKTGAQETAYLIAAEEVEKGGWIRLFFRSIGDFFSNLFSGIKNIF